MGSSIQGKSVLVTGGSKGIGKGIAGCSPRAATRKVLVVSRHLAEAEAVAKEIGGGASGFAADVTKLRLEAAAKARRTAMAGLDVLCANAGVFRRRSSRTCRPSNGTT